MEKNTVLYIIIALLVGFVGGFLLANNLNRSEMLLGRSVQSSNSSGQPGAANAGEPELSDAEIQMKIDEADRNPTNLDFNKQLGIGLYRYAAMKSSVPLLIEASRILNRAHSIDAKDHDILVAYGNAEFDLGFFQKDPAKFASARDIYTKALAEKPDDVDVQTDLSISYLLQGTPDLDKAVAGLKKAQTIDPKHTRSLQFLVEAYTRQSNVKEAETALARLRDLDPKNQQLGDLTARLEAVKAGSK
jgi:tetratricopeptide (TPR) repeat protein